MAECSPGLAGVPAAESKVCFIDGTAGVLEYRGYLIEQLENNRIFRPSQIYVGNRCQKFVPIDKRLS